MNEDNQSDDSSSIDRMQQRLYSRNARHTRSHRRRRFRDRADTDVKKGWGDMPSRDISDTLEHKMSPFFSKMLIGSIVFFVFALIISAFIFIGGGKDVSPRNVEIVIQGPSTVEGGEDTTLQIAITNKNTVPILLADLIMEFPDGTRTSSDIGEELSRLTESIGTIPAGEQVQKTVKAVFFGTENESKNITVTVEYRIEGSNAIFFNDHLYEFTLGSTPLTVTISSLDEVISGQDVSLTAKIISNSSSVIKDVLLVAEYPFGFEFTSAKPEPSFTQNVWELGDLEPEGERIITIKGTILGEDGDERVIRFSGGIQSPNDEKEFATTFMTTLQSVVIKKPFISVALALSGDTSPNFVAGSGQKVRADITWFNNLPVQVTDATLEVSLRGEALNKNSVSVERGFYRSVDNTIIWSKETDPNFTSIAPGESGRVSFSFAPFGVSSGVQVTNPEINLVVDILGKRISARNVPEEIRSSITRTVKVASDLLFTTRAVHFTGPFNNSGPMPPQAEKETTYTIIWTVTNSTNAVSDVRVDATLPSYVRWMNVVDPTDGKVTYNPIGGKVLWDIGDLPAGGTTGSPQREVAFQVALLPSLSHVRTDPVVINKQTVGGYDQFTERTITGTKSALTTRLSTDPGFRTGMDEVTP